MWILLSFCAVAVGVLCPTVKFRVSILIINVYCMIKIGMIKICYRKPVLRLLKEVETKLVYYV